MANFNRNAARYYVDPPILANSEGNYATEHVTVSRDYVGLNTEGFKAVPAGLFVANVGGVKRFLPRVKLTSASSTGATTFNVNPSQVLIPGDVLYVLEPYAILTITASTASQTQTITINGQVATATVSSSTVATSATEVAAAVNAHPYLSTIVRAIATGATVWFFAKDGETNYGITEGGTVTATLSGSTLAVNNTAIGTIAFVTPLTDGVSGTLTLTGNASIALPVGTNVGIPVSAIYGVYIHSIDFTEYATKALALYTQSNAVRIQHLPYFDDNLRKVFRGRLYFDTQF